MSKLEQLRALREQSAQPKRKAQSAPVKSKPPALPQPSSRKKTGAKGKSGPVTLRAALKSSSIRGRPRMEDRDKTLTATEPWKALGFSRRTFFRRLEEQRRKQELLDNK